MVRRPTAGVLSALEELLEGTGYEGFHRVSTRVSDGSKVYAERNLVILSRFEIMESDQYRNDYAPASLYREVTASGRKMHRPTR